MFTCNAWLAFTIKNNYSLVMLDAFSSPIKALSVMKAIGMRWAWLLPWIAHIKKAGVGVAQLHTIRVINAWLEVRAKNNTRPTECLELVITYT